MKYWVHIVVLLGFYLFVGCEGDDSKPPKEIFSSTPYLLSIPDHFPDPVLPKNNPLTEEGVHLGRKLYYDPLLSSGGPNNGLSCSSCHFQSFSFSIPTTGTAVLPHINLAWNQNFLWNGKVGGSLEDIMLFEVKDFFQTDVQQLQQSGIYPRLFWNAFGDSLITQQSTAQALAQFFRTMISGDSKFDRYLQHKETLSYSELTGLEIFFSEKGDCFHCHSIPLMTDNSFHNIGLDSVFTNLNDGRFEVTGKNYDKGSFKTPTLRNIELTAPYMHDGRFLNLEDVIEHYNSGVKHSNSLDPIMTKSGKEFGLELTPSEKQALVDFLLTLTDTVYISNKLLSKPD